MPERFGHVRLRQVHRGQTHRGRCLTKTLEALSCTISPRAGGQSVCKAVSILTTPGIFQHGTGIITFPKVVQSEYVVTISTLKMIISDWQMNNKTRVLLQVLSHTNLEFLLVLSGTTPHVSTLCLPDVTTCDPNFQVFLHTVSNQILTAWERGQVKCTKGRDQEIPVSNSPHLWTQISMVSGRSQLITCVIPGTSIPCEATSVATSTSTPPAWHHVRHMGGSCEDW